MYKLLTRCRKTGPDIYNIYIVFICDLQMMTIFYNIVQLPKTLKQRQLWHGILHPPFFIHMFFFKSKQSLFVFKFCVLICPIFNGYFDLIIFFTFIFRLTQREGYNKNLLIHVGWGDTQAFNGSKMTDQLELIYPLM